MTAQKQFKACIRARMARTGERYAAARAHLSGGEDRAGAAPIVDHGWTLRGGTDPDAAALANLLAHQRVTGPDGPLPEELVFAVAGGLGAGYILWEFRHDDSRIVTLGFANPWNYLDRRLTAALDRFGLDAEWSRTGGAGTAAATLRHELGAGNPVLVWPDHFTVGYWHLPPSLDGHGGHPVVAYAETDDRVHLDDRTLSPLTVASGDLDRARARVGSYRHALLALRSHDVRIPERRLQSAVRAGLRDTVDHLGGSSESFAAPAWRKWSRRLVPGRDAKAWPRVFADGTGLFGALLSVWEGIEPAGMTGGNLRGLFARALTAASPLLGTPRLAEEADRWLEIAALWHDIAEAAMPADVTTCARARELTAGVTGAVAEGDLGADDRAAASTELWRLRAQHDATPPLNSAEIADVLAAMSGGLQQVYDAETAALARLNQLLGPGPAA